MVVYIITKPYAGAPTDREQILGRKYLIVILQCEALLDGARQALDRCGQALQSGGFIAVGTTTVNVDHICSHPIGDHGLVDQFLDGLLPDIRSGRSDYHELIRMKTGTNPMATGKFTTLAKRIHDLLVPRQVVDLITLLGMCDQWENLAVDSKSPKTGFATIGERFQQGFGVVQAQVTEVAKLVHP